MCEHAKPWMVSIEVECILENGRKRPGRAEHQFWCRECGDVLERKWIDESKMSFGDALSYAGITSWAEARKLPLSPEAAAKEAARWERYVGGRESAKAVAQFVEQLWADEGRTMVRRPQR